MLSRFKRTLTAVLARWVQRPYGMRMYRAYCTGNITAWEYRLRVYLYVWR